MFKQLVISEQGYHVLCIMLRAQFHSDSKINEFLCPPGSAAGLSAMLRWCSNLNKGLPVMKPEHSIFFFHIPLFF
jgi:hypothetical protein